MAGGEGRPGESINSTQIRIRRSSLRNEDRVATTIEQVIDRIGGMARDLEEQHLQVGECQVNLARSQGHHATMEEMRLQQELGQAESHQIQVGHAQVASLRARTDELRRKYEDKIREMAPALGQQQLRVR